MLVSGISIRGLHFFEYTFTTSSRFININKFIIAYRSCLYSLRITGTDEAGSAPTSVMTFEIDFWSVRSKNTELEPSSGMNSFTANASSWTRSLNLIVSHRTKTGMLRAAAITATIDVPTRECKLPLLTMACAPTISVVTPLITYGSADISM